MENTIEYWSFLPIEPVLVTSAWREISNLISEFLYVAVEIVSIFYLILHYRINNNTNITFTKRKYLHINLVCFTTKFIMLEK